MEQAFERGFHRALARTRPSFKLGIRQLDHCVHLLLGEPRFRRNVLDFQLLGQKPRLES
jgi:hypothetical protein